MEANAALRLAGELAGKARLILGEIEQRNGFYLDRHEAKDWAADLIRASHAILADQQATPRRPSAVIVELPRLPDVRRDNSGEYRA